MCIHMHRTHSLYTHYPGSIEPQEVTSLQLKDERNEVHEVSLRSRKKGEKPQHERQLQEKQSGTHALYEI